MPSPISFRVAQIEDSLAIFDAHQDAVLTLCQSAYTPAQMKIWFEGRTHEIHHRAIQAGQILLAERHGRVLGFAGFTPGEVTLLFVRPDTAGTGLGRQLLHLAMDRARLHHAGPLTVVATRNSQGFYEKHGFVAVEASFFVRGTPDTRFEVVNMRERGRS